MNKWISAIDDTSIIELLHRSYRLFIAYRIFMNRELFNELLQSKDLHFFIDVLKVYSLIEGAAEHEKHSASVPSRRKEKGKRDEHHWRNRDGIIFRRWRKRRKNEATKVEGRKRTKSWASFRRLSPRWHSRSPGTASDFSIRDTGENLHFYISPLHLFFFINISLRFFVFSMPLAVTSFLCLHRHVMFCRLPVLIYIHVSRLCTNASEKTLHVLG